jgi:uroporphyrinogen-III synthase
MPTVLTTKKLSKSQQSLLFYAGISWVSYNAIQINYPAHKSIPLQVENAIITSKNTWIAIKDNTKVQNAFVVGNKTENLLQENGINILEVADYGKILAEKICKHHAKKSFHFFCGSKRRDELPKILNQNHVQFEEHEVYETILNPKRFEQEFDGVLFFSPSGVESYFSNNKIKGAIAFCIGNTTAKAAEKHTPNIVIAHKPSIENVIVQVVKSFKK